MEALMNATVGQIVGGGLGIITILSMLIEFTPIKWNPISAFLNWIGHRTNKELFTKVEELEEKINRTSANQEALEAQFAERNAINCRVRILRFSDELRRGVEHSQESYEQVIADVDLYEKYCDGHPDFVNNKTVVAKKRIVQTYEDRLLKNDFL